MIAFADWLLHVWTTFMCAWTLIEVLHIRRTLAERDERDEESEQ